MATLAESFLADLEDLSDVEDEEPQQAGLAGEGEDEEVRGERLFDMSGGLAGAAVAVRSQLLGRGAVCWCLPCRHALQAVTGPVLHCSGSRRLLLSELVVTCARTSPYLPSPCLPNDSL